MSYLTTLRAKREDTSQKMAAVAEKAAAEGRALNDDERKAFDGYDAEIKAIDGDIKRAEILASEAKVDRVVGPRVTGGTRADAEDPKFGFKGFGDYLSAVRSAAFGRVDERLMNAITTYGNEGVGGDGGFAVPPQYANQIAELVKGEDTLLGRLNPIPVSGNQLVLPVDETTPHGTTGIYAEWLAEGGAMTARKPVLKQATVTLHKVGALVYLTDELLEDAPAMQAYLTAKVGSAITGKVNEALVNGDGVGKPLGFRNAPSIVTQAKSGATLAALDVSRMKSRIFPQSKNGSFWVVHSTAVPNLHTLVLGQSPIMLQTLKEDAPDIMLGRPIVESEYCSDYNTLGDILMVAPDGYVAAVKSGGAKADLSIHFAFDQGIQAFRTTMRVGGLPIASAATARKNGSTTLSHFVQLEVRS